MKAFCDRGLSAVSQEVWSGQIEDCRIDRRHRRRNYDIPETDIELHLNTRGIQGRAEPDANTLVLGSFGYAFTLDRNGIENETVVRRDVPCTNFPYDARHCPDVVAHPAKKID